jgi:hypothetical protein
MSTDFVVVIGDLAKGFRLIGPYPNYEAALVAAVHGGLPTWVVLPLEAMPAKEEPRRRRSRAKKEAPDAEQ